MKFSTISAALALLATSALASPVPADAPSKRQFEAQITFQGAPPDVAFYTLSFPTDGSFVPICKPPLLFSIPCFRFTSNFPCHTHAELYMADNPLSISHIKSSGGATCTFNGIDGSRTTVVGAQTVDVGPPQTQTGGSCRAL